MVVFFLCVCAVGEGEGIKLGQELPAGVVGGMLAVAVTDTALASTANVCAKAVATTASAALGSLLSPICRLVSIVTVLSGPVLLTTQTKKKELAET